MNWDQAKGNWKQIKGKIREQWGELTDDELDIINGRREQLAGSIQNLMALLARKPSIRSTSSKNRIEI